jgi:ElaB/YqjD/DUF883 family membrane-anchored ribosome-binding protein
MRTDGVEKPVMIEDALREASKLKSVVAEAVDDGVRSASQAIKRGRYAAEDALEEAEHTIKQRPFQSMGAAFAAGLLAGGIVVWLGSRRR